METSDDKTAKLYSKAKVDDFISDLSRNGRRPYDYRIYLKVKD